MDLTTIATKLTRQSNGIWTASDRHDVSYPEDGNEACFSIEETSFWFRHRNNVILQLANDFSPNKTFFDIGGGNGCVSHFLQSAGIEAVLVEPGPVGAINARSRGVRTVIQSTLEDAGFMPGSIPSAGLFDVVEHIEDDVRFLHMIHEYLQPNGVVYITVPAHRLLWSNDDRLAGHFRRYSTGLLADRLTETGFTVRYISYLFSFLVPPIFVFRSLPSAVGLRKTVPRSTTQKEHAGGSGIVNKLLQRLLTAELNRVKHHKPVYFGSSCVAVAVKSQ